jgi:hypothetical protein
LIDPTTLIARQKAQIEERLAMWSSRLNAGPVAWGTVTPGLVLDAEAALNSPCRRITLPDGSTAIFSLGIVGPLSREQVETYCRFGVEDVEDAEMVEAVVNARAGIRACIEYAADAGAYGKCLERVRRARDGDPDDAA